MRQGVIHQIAQQLIQQRRLATQPHRFIGLQRQRHPALVRQWRHGHAQLAGQLAQIEQLRTALGNRSGAIFDARQRQQLIGQMSQTIGALGRRFQRRPPDLRVI